jgi:hypothetical protein
MNAYELAKELEDFSYSYELDIALLPVINMLRQQQAEIEALKAKLQLHEAMDNQCASLMQQFRKAQEK